MPDLQNIRDLLREFVHSNDRVNDVISDQSGASSSTRSLIIIDDNDLAELGPNADQNVSAIPSTGKNLTMTYFAYMFSHI